MGDQSPSQAGRLEVVCQDDELITSLPFESIGPFAVLHGCNIVRPKEASKVLANYRKSTGKAYPLFVHQEIGKSASFAMTSDWTPYGGIDFMKWPYYPDFALNLASYVTGNRVPQDVELVHRARALMEDYRSVLQTMESVIEFVSKFGANLAPAEKMLADVAEEEKAGKAAYIDADLDISVQHLQRALDDLVTTSDRIWRLKDQALFWVYLTEWLVVAPLEWYALSLSGQSW